MSARRTSGLIAYRASGRADVAGWLDWFEWERPAPRAPPSYNRRMRRPPFQFAIEVQANIYREGRWWVAECPAFTIASQGRTKTEARAMLIEALELSWEVHRERGTFEQYIEGALLHPSSRKVSPAAERVTVPLSPKLAAATAHVQALAAA